MNLHQLRQSVIKKIILIASFCISPYLLAETKDVDLVSKKVEELRHAMIDGDAKALNALSSPSLSYGHSSGNIEDQLAFIEKLASGKSDFVTMELSDQIISISGDTALVRHNLTADIKDGGVPNRIHLGILLVWQKQSGDWKLLARQAFKYPQPAQ